MCPSREGSMQLPTDHSWPRGLSQLVPCAARHPLSLGPPRYRAMSFSSVCRQQQSEQGDQQPPRARAHVADPPSQRQSPYAAKALRGQASPHDHPAPRAASSHAEKLLRDLHACGQPCTTSCQPCRRPASNPVDDLTSISSSDLDHALAQPD
ncbi:hypothetical protein Dimus_014705 [Dionaea muscipula]